jgi:hypothetical protein
MNHAFQSDMQRIDQAAATGHVSAYNIARDRCHAFARHKQLDGRTAVTFVDGLAPFESEQERADLIAEFDAIIAKYKSAKHAR